MRILVTASYLHFVYKIKEILEDEGYDVKIDWSGEKYNGTLIVFTHELYTDFIVTTKKHYEQLSIVLGILRNSPLVIVLKE